MPVALQEVTVLNVSRETGQVAVVKDGNIEIVKNEPKGLEPIDPKELGPKLQTGRASSLPGNTRRTRWR